VDARHQALDRRLRDQVPGLDLPRQLRHARSRARHHRRSAAPHRLGRSHLDRGEGRNLHAHLQSPEFFDSERHPAITFDSTAWRIDGDRLVIDGTLTIKGDTRPVQAHGTFTAPHEDPWGNTRLGITLEAAIDRSHFGLSWNTPLPKGGLALANDVRLHVDLQLIKAS
jgi:polyisoprenoid-binding protein YceI